MHMVKSRKKIKIPDMEYSRKIAVELGQKKRVEIETHEISVAPLADEALSIYDNPLRDQLATKLTKRRFLIKKKPKCFNVVDLDKAMDKESIVVLAYIEKISGDQWKIRDNSGSKTICVKKTKNRMVGGKIVGMYMEKEDQEFIIRTMYTKSTSQ